MRDQILDYADLDDDDAEVTPSRGGLGAVQTLALVGALALIAAPAFKSISRRWKVRHPQASTEPAIDKQLKDSFPASDPPASRYFDIPENRK